MLHDIAGVAASAAGRAIAQYLFGEPMYRCVEWSGTMRLPLAPGHVRDVVYRHYCQNTSGCLARGTHSEQLIERGDPSITRVPTSRQLTWVETPMRIAVTYTPVRGGIEVKISYCTPAETEFTKQGAEFVVAQAEREFDGVFEAMKESRSPAGPRAPKPDRVTEALRILGLRPGASWTDVQTAYREASKKYHPDTLSGKGLPPHVVDLAVAKFREITEAYQLLKRELGA